MGDLSYKARTHYQATKVAESYDNERFSSWHGRIAHRLEVRALEYAVGRYFKPGSRVLDTPCGTGRLLHVYSKGNFKVVGADISEKMLERAQKRFFDSPAYSFRVCDAEELPFETGEFDCVVSFRLMCHLPRKARQNVLKELARVTRDILAVNYHVDVKSPLMLFNKLFRKQAAHLPYPLRQRDLDLEISDLDLDLEILETRKLSWFERSSALVVMRRAGHRA